MIGEQLMDARGCPLMDGQTYLGALVLDPSDPMPAFHAAVRVAGDRLVAVTVPGNGVHSVHVLANHPGPGLDTSMLMPAVGPVDQDLFTLGLMLAREPVTVHRLLAKRRGHVYLVGPHPGEFRVFLGQALWSWAGIRHGWAATWLRLGRRQPCRRGFCAPVVPVVTDDVMPVDRWFVHLVPEAPEDGPAGLLIHDHGLLLDDAWFTEHPVLAGDDGTLVCLDPSTGWTIQQLRALDALRGVV